mgnify:CR=1 FL=1
MWQVVKTFLDNHIDVVCPQARLDLVDMHTVCNTVGMSTMTIHPAEAIARIYGWSVNKLASKAQINRETLRRRLANGEEFSWPETLALAYALDVEPQVLTEMTDEEAVAHAMRLHTDWRAKRWLLPSECDNSTCTPHTVAA